MATKIRPELSRKNKYHISKHRQYELKHFCLQYHDWKREYESWDDVTPSTTKYGHIRSSTAPGDPTLKMIIKRDECLSRIKLIEKAAMDTDEFLYDYILKAVTEGRSFTYLKNVLNIPCSRDTYYDRYRKFFWILNNLRG